MAKARQMFEDGTYSQAELHTLAVRLQQARNHLHAITPVEANTPETLEAYDHLRTLLQSGYITRGEAKDLGYRIRVSRPSEYPWLQLAIEGAIVARSEAKMLAA
jgi:hypothetical protein